MPLDGAQSLNVIFGFDQEAQLLLFLSLGKLLDSTVASQIFNQHQERCNAKALLELSLTAIHQPNPVVDDIT
jgi:hypothetical protein